jgi:hypothetical protein
MTNTISSWKRKREVKTRYGRDFLSLKKSTRAKANPPAKKPKMLKRTSLGRFIGSIELPGETKRETAIEVPKT